MKSSNMWIPVPFSRDRYQDILLVPSQEARPLQPGIGIVIQIQAGSVGVEEITRHANVAGTVHVEGPVERPWNVRDVTIHDLDGYRLRFSEPVDTTKNFKDVMRQQEE